MQQMRNILVYNIVVCKITAPQRLELVSERSLSSAVRHIDFHLLRRIYVALIAHSIALSLQY